MRGLIVAAAVTLLLSTVLPLAAQQEAPGVVAKWHLVIVKPGESLQFENTYREHLKLHALNSETVRRVSRCCFLLAMLRTLGLFAHPDAQRRIRRPDECAGQVVPACAATAAAAAATASASPR